MIKATINNRNALFDVGICAGTSGLKARNISCLNRSPESFLLLFRAFEIYSETLTRRIVKEPFLRRRCRRMWNQKCNDKALNSEPANDKLQQRREFTFAEPFFFCFWKIITVNATSDGAAPDDATVRNSFTCVLHNLQKMELKNSRLREFRLHKPGELNRPESYHATPGKLLSIAGIVSIHNSLMSGGKTVPVGESHRPGGTCQLSCDPNQF